MQEMSEMEESTYRLILIDNVTGNMVGDPWCMSLDTVKHQGTQTFRECSTSKRHTNSKSPKFLMPDANAEKWYSFNVIGEGAVVDEATWNELSNMTSDVSVVFDGAYTMASSDVEKLKVGSAVSAAHCQKGSTMQAYRLYASTA